MWVHVVSREAGASESKAHSVTQFWGCVCVSQLFKHLDQPLMCCLAAFPLHLGTIGWFKIHLGFKSVHLPTALMLEGISSPYIKHGNHLSWELQRYLGISTRLRKQQKWRKARSGNFPCFIYKNISCMEEFWAFHSWGMKLIRGAGGGLKCWYIWMIVLGVGAREAVERLGRGGGLAPGMRLGRSQPARRVLPRAGCSAQVTGVAVRPRAAARPSCLR